MSVAMQQQKTHIDCPLSLTTGATMVVVAEESWFQI